jgi:hypothetical protein
MEFGLSIAEAGRDLQGYKKKGDSLSVDRTYYDGGGVQERTLIHLVQGDIALLK